MPKQSLLPPADDSQKRDVSVNLRFSADVYERLKTVAEFSRTGVASLLFYVTVNTTLPLMEKEMQRANQDARSKAKPSAAPEASETPEAFEIPIENLSEE